jgi:hypothetical protein
MAITPFRHLAVAATLLIVSTTATPNKRDGTFANPSAQVRPFFRYWLPDGSVDPTVVASDIRSAAEVGAGGIEFLPYYGYGGAIGGNPPGSDWVTYGFGSAPLQHLLQVALEAAKENSVLVDIALGPNQGQGVPASPDADGIQWDLVSAVQPSLWCLSLANFAHGRCHSSKDYQSISQVSVSQVGGKGN